MVNHVVSTVVLLVMLSALHIKLWTSYTTADTELEIAGMNLTIEYYLLNYTPEVKIRWKFW